MADVLHTLFNTAFNHAKNEYYVQKTDATITIKCNDGVLRDARPAALRALVPDNYFLMTVHRDPSSLRHLHDFNTPNNFSKLN